MKRTIAATATVVAMSLGLLTGTGNAAGPSTPASTTSVTSVAFVIPAGVPNPIKSIKTSWWGMDIHFTKVGTEMILAGVVAGGLGAAGPVVWVAIVSGVAGVWAQEAISEGHCLGMSIPWTSIFPVPTLVGVQGIVEQC